MTVALYCRVSTEEQAEHGFSIDHQKERLEAYCKSQGWPDFEFYVDDGYTGTNMDRPALKRLIRHCERGKIKMVVVYKLDRLGRKQKDVLYLLEEVFDTAHVGFKSATEPFDTSTPFGKAMLGILAVFAQLERDTIIERTRSGMRQRVRQGFWKGGPVPFGYSYQPGDGKLTVIPYEVELVKAVFDRYLQGHSLLSIAEWLAPKAGSRYVDHSFIKDVLQRPVYAGNVSYGEDISEGKHEALVSLDVWNKVQEELQRRSDGRKPYGKYLLSSLLTCGGCGSPMKYQVHKRKKRSTYEFKYYICTNKQKNGKEACPTSKYYNATKLESQVVAMVKDISLRPHDVINDVKRLTDEEDSPERLESLNDELKQIDEQLDRLVDLVQTGSMSTERILPRIESLEQRRNLIEEQIDTLQDVIPKRKTEDDWINALRYIGDQWDALTFDEQCMVLRQIATTITVYPDKEPEPTWNLE